jgi:hypothetical protein
VRRRPPRARVSFTGAQRLLAVDVGVRAGLALYGDDGRLIWYRSRNFGSTARLRRAAPGLLAGIPGLAYVALEGGGTVADVWEREADRLAATVIRVSAEEWRGALLYPREQRTGAQAKQRADGLARRVIAWSGAPRPTSLNDDAAEAVLVGLWAVVTVGWLDAIPTAVRR